MAKRTKKSLKIPFGYCVVCPSLIYGFMDSDYLFGIFQLFFVLLAIILSVLLRYKEKLEATKEVIRIHKSKDRQRNGQKDKEELEDTKVVIRISMSKKDIAHNGQKNKVELEIYYISQNR
jgi:uncharacterized protein YxeA